MNYNQKNQDTTEYLQITTSLISHWSRALLYPGTYTVVVFFFLIFTIENLQTNANKYNSNIIFCGLDLVKMLWQKQCYIKYRRIQMQLGNSFPETTSEVTVLQSIVFKFMQNFKLPRGKKTTKLSHHDQTLLHQDVSQNLKQYDH